MCGNTGPIWFKDEEANDGIQYFGPDSGDNQLSLGKLEPVDDKFRWSYRLTAGSIVTGISDDEETGREIIETFEQAVEMIGDYPEIIAA